MSTGFLTRVGAAAIVKPSMSPPNASFCTNAGLAKAEDLLGTGDETLPCSKVLKELWPFASM